jgi:nucleoside-diphosphate-sugar epimerase
MTTQATQGGPILVTGAAGDVGAVGRHLAAMLLDRGHRVRTLVRREDERAEGLRRLGAEVVRGDLTDLGIVNLVGYKARHRAAVRC